MAALASLIAVALPATADEPAGRYSVLPSPDGFIRIDTTTGAVSHCGKRDGAWYCDVLIEDRGLIERRIDALTAQIAALAERIEKLSARIDALPPPQPPAPPAPPAAPPSFTDTLMHRLFALVRELKGMGEGS